MAQTKTLLRVPELIKAIQPLVSKRITHEDIFRLIGTGDIKPHGVMGRIPLFDLSQIGDIAKNFQPSKPTLLEGHL